MSTSAAVHTVTDGSFAAAIALGTGLVAVDFSAEWCAPCRVMEPIVEAAATELAPAIRFLCMDTEAEPATMVRYGVSRGFRLCSCSATVSLSIESSAPCRRRLSSSDSGASSVLVDTGGLPKKRRRGGPGHRPRCVTYGERIGPWLGCSVSKPLRGYYNETLPVGKVRWRSSRLRRLCWPKRLRRRNSEVHGSA